MKQIEPKVKDGKVVVGPLRLSYVHLLEKYKYEGDTSDGKYSVVVMVPESDPEYEATRKAIAQARAYAIQQGAAKWGNSKPSEEKTRVFSRPKNVEKNPEMAGMLVATAKSNKQPWVMDAYRQPLRDPDKVYSGMWCIVSMSFFPYASVGQKGVSLLLDGVVKVADDARLGGSSPDSDLAGIDLAAYASQAAAPSVGPAGSLEDLL